MHVPTPPRVCPPARGRMRAASARAVLTAVIGLLIAVAAMGSGLAARAQPVDVTPALLTTADLPDGWADWANPTPGGDTLLESGVRLVLCRTALDAPGPDSIASGSAAFYRQHGQLADLLREVIAVFPPGDGQRVMGALRDALTACATDPANTARGTGPSGQVIVYALSPLPFEDLGDETLAVEMSQDGDYTNVVVTMVAVRRADVVMLLAYSGYSFYDVTVDHAWVESLARDAAERLDLLAP